MPNWACEFDSHLGHLFRAEVVENQRLPLFRGQNCTEIAPVQKFSSPISAPINTYSVHARRTDTQYRFRHYTLAYRFNVLHVCRRFFDKIAAKSRFCGDYVLWRWRRAVKRRQGSAEWRQRLEGGCARHLLIRHSSSKLGSALISLRVCPRLTAPIPLSAAKTAERGGNEVEAQDEWSHRECQAGSRRCGAI